MKINFESLIPVYVQIAEAIEDDIIGGRLAEGGPAYSQLVIAKELNVNPATAAKGISLLVSKGILETRRGSSMAVAAGALPILLAERREKGFKKLVKNLVGEAAKLNLTQKEIIDEIIRQYADLEDERDE